ncbi:hypothetical protein [Chitinophaga ginsengisoli]|uniref:hypothetical protein n=1 Tax=Chitinophaga ginsengisoli TaxID=363837 RepID=UPI001FE6BF57|nr:hypothetical protein [Chitinophaga ginsengisoli]
MCPRCGRLLSRSGSKGNGGIYYYYHCQSVKVCKERFRGDTANEAFVRQLGQIAVNAPIIDYYCQIISQSELITRPRKDLDHLKKQKRVSQK